MFFDWTSTVRFVCLSACLFYVPVRVYVCLWHVSIENNKSQQLCKHNDILFEVEQPYKQCIDLNYSSNYELVIQKKLICILDLIWNMTREMHYAWFRFMFDLKWFQNQCIITINENCLEILQLITENKWVQLCRSLYINNYIWTHNNFVGRKMNW